MSEKYNILYVDDEPDNLVVFKSSFRREYNVYTTTSPKEALELVQSKEFPIIITDQRMPDITGVDFLQMLPPHINNIRMILTGFADVEVIIDAINEGRIYRYISKPWVKEELQVALKNAIDKYLLEKKNQELLIDLKIANESLEEKVKLRTEELEKKKDESEKLLLNILPEETAKELKEFGKVKSRLYSDVTILFWDIVDFTKIAEEVSPEELISALDYYYGAFDRIMEKHGIEKIKTVGDAYLAASGIPIANPEHASISIRAAKDVMAFIAQERKEREASGQVFFEIRLGIHTGEVIGGVVGCTKYSFDIWGVDVNLASRLESSSEIGKINISQSTYDLIKEQFECVPRGKVKAKGIGELEMYFVV